MSLRHKIVILSTLLGCSLFLSSCTNYSLTHSAENDYRHHYYARAFSKLYWPATLGYARAQYMYGYLYYYGYGTMRDQDVGREWIRRSAEKNYYPAIWAYRQITTPRYEQYIPFQAHHAEPFHSNKRTSTLGDKKRTSK